MKDSIVIMIAIHVTHVLLNVNIVKIMLTTVLNVFHQEPVLQNVDVQMDSSIMETLVLVVIITVPLVKTETNVSLALISEPVPQLVNVHPDTMTQVKLNVNFVT
jgi:hypothetical protein